MVEGISKAQVKRLHSMLIAETGGLDGVRDEGTLESCLESPFQSFGGDDFYPSIEEKAARLAFLLIKNHPFIDGNKRIAAHTMVVFLLLNGIVLSCSDREIADITLKVAASEKDYPDLVGWINAYER